MYHIHQPMGTEHSVKVMVWLGDCWPLGMLTGERSQVEMWSGTPSSLRARKGGREEWTKSRISGTAHPALPLPARL